MFRYADEKKKAHPSKFNILDPKYHNARCDRVHAANAVKNYKYVPAKNKETDRARKRVGRV